MLVIETFAMYVLSKEDVPFIIITNEMLAQLT